ncbi:MAG: phosphotransferase [Paenisporosarcina sp.]
MNEQLREKVKEIVGEINKVIVLDEQGCTSEVRQLITDGDSYLLKSSFKKKYRNWLKSEANVLDNLNNQNLIQVPTFFGYIEDNGSSHLIMSFENGITLTTALKNAETTSEKKVLIKSFGHFLNQLHTTKIIESLNHKNNWLDQQLVKATSYVDRGETDGSLELLEKIQSNKPIPVQQTMIHGDCTTDNVLVVDGEVRLFIDVSGMTVGDPRYDESLAIRSFITNEEYIKAFYEGYKRNTISKGEFEYFDEGLYEFF